MSQQALDQLNPLLPTLPTQYYRLLLIAGPHGMGKTRLLKELSQQESLPYLNLLTIVHYYFLETLN